MTTFQWPFPVSTISSDYGPRPNVGKGYHDGADFAVARGTGIPAAADGTVTSVWIHPDAGPNSIDIDHGNGVHTQYWHCDSKRVRAGQRVKRGDIIGTVGNRGLSYGPHLHFEVHAPGSPSGRSTWPPRAFLESRGVATDFAFGLSKSAQKNLQQVLKNKKLYSGAVDGKFGKESVKAMQTLLKDEGLLDKNYTVDGVPGTTYGKAIQNLAKRSGYVGKVDGAPGSGTSTALTNWAESQTKSTGATTQEGEEEMLLRQMSIKGDTKVYAVSTITGRKWHIPNRAYQNLLITRGIITKDVLTVPKNEFDFFCSLWNRLSGAISLGRSGVCC